MKTLQEQLAQAEVDRDKAIADWHKACADRLQADVDRYEADAEIFRIQKLIEERNRG
jgi:hypothetical protein